MPTVWLSLKKSFHCKSEPEDIHIPQSLKALHGCPNLKDVVKNRGILESSCSPKSIASNEFVVNPVSQKVVHSTDSQCQSRISGRALVQIPLASDCCAVSELCEGDSSRKIVDIIFRTSWFEAGIGSGSEPCERLTERVVKVHNMQKTLARFEEYREMVKAKASKLPKKHPRCLADGNELLRFHGTTMMCSLGMNGSSSLCKFEGCNVCRIIEMGFCNNTDCGDLNYKGIYTTSTSRRAHDSIRFDQQNGLKRAMLVCRVIAGRVLKPMGDFDSFCSGIPSGFDSVAGEVGPHYNLEELFVFNPRAVLPCFVVIYRS